MWLYETLEGTRRPSQVIRKTSYEIENYSPIKQYEFDESQKNSLTDNLNRIDPDLDYESWIAVIFACINIYGNHAEVHHTLNQWSSTGVKYDESEFWKRINSYDPNHRYKAGYLVLSEIQWEFPKKINPIPKNEFGENLGQPLHNRVVNQLDKHGNKPSVQHKTALNIMTSTMAHAVDSSEKFRIAFPLETGMGKTTCVVALACELQHTDKSLLICAEQIDQLEEMRFAMIEEGVEKSKIGIYHKKAKVGTPSIALEDMNKYQFLLVSHSRVNNDSKNYNTERLLSYANSKRDLTIWDESLITTEVYYCSLFEMNSAVSDWLTRYQGKLNEGKYSKKHSDDNEVLKTYFLQVLEILNGDVYEKIIELPTVSSDILNQNLINSIVTSENYRVTLNTLIVFNKFGNVRIAKADGYSLVQFIQFVDDSFDKIIIMDASSRIRKLISFDESISIQPLGVNKTYQDVEIKHADVASSKSSFDDKSLLKDYLKEFTYLLDNEIPNDKEVIVFCHKDLKDGINAWLLEMFPLREIHVLNWGQHKATNQFRHIEYIINCGVQFRDWKEIASSIIAQTGNLNYSLLDNDANETYYSEQGELLYQGFSRGNSRNTIDGRAGKQTIYLFHPQEHYDKVMPYLRRVMNGVKESKYQTKYLTQGRKNARDYLYLANSIQNYILSVGHEITRLSKTLIKKSVAPEMSSNSKTWRKAMEIVESNLSGWTFGKHLIHRV